MSPLPPADTPRPGLAATPRRAHHAPPDAKHPHPDTPGMGVFVALRRSQRPRYTSAGVVMSEDAAAARRIAPSGTFVYTVVVSIFWCPSSSCTARRSRSTA